MRWRSFQACVESTTSRGVDGLVLHSGSYSMQNSPQPMGARAVSPSVTNSGRSCAMLPLGDATSASAMMLAIAPCLRNALAPELIVTPSGLVGVAFRAKLLGRGSVEWYY